VDALVVMHTDREIPNCLQENLSKCHFVPARIPRILLWVQTRGFTVKDWRLTAWSGAQLMRDPCTVHSAGAAR